MNVDLQEMELVAAAPAAESGDVGRRGLERLLWTYRQIRPEHQPLRQLLDTRGRARRLGRLADEPADRGPAGRLARCPASFDEQRRICAELQMQLWQDVPYIPMGEYWQSTAYRKDLIDVLPGCFAVFYGVRRG